jgi:hypothetical protein
VTPRGLNHLHWAIPAGQDLPAKNQEGEAWAGRACHPVPGGKPLPYKASSVIKHFLFVRYFIVIFIGSFYWL